MRWQVLLASLAVVVVLVVPCSADLITNGSFETFGTLSANGDYLAYSGCGKLDVTQHTSWDGVIPTYYSTTALPGWTTSRISDQGFAWIVNNVKTGVGYGNIEDGSALNVGNSSNTAEWISQSFAVTAGTPYVVSYYEKYRSSGETLQGIISADGGTLTLGTSTITTPTGTGTATLTQTTLGTDSIYANYTFTFTASQNTQATLTFKSGTFGEGTFLDNVTVTPTPEPSTLVLVGSGLVGLLCYAWRKRR